MVMFASQVSQQIYQSQLEMAQQQQHAQMMSMQMGLMPQMSMMAAASPGQSGMYGEQLAGRLAGAGRTTMGLAGLGVGLAGSMTGLPLDPFSAAIKGFRGGRAIGGIAGGLGGAALAAAPFAAAGMAVDYYAGAFNTGMQQQAATNSMLRQNFNFQGGQGAMGRGFSQGQMGAIGSMITGEVNRMPTTSSQELNQLISQGTEAGMFTAVRDVESFTKRFRTMLDGLRKIQKELGGTLSEALQFTRGAQQVGIFTTGGRTAFAAEMRDTMTATGMDQTQLFSLAATGSMLSRATGGVGRQGAMGAMRTARTLGTAVQTGAINAELLSEATGGLQGEEAIQAFTARTLQQSDRFSRTAQGRYSLFALSNAQGSGLDETMLARFRSGDISVGSVMRDARGNVNRMGRAKALNSEGRLRGAMMEEGGMSGQIGMMRLMLGDRALSGGDDLAQLVMQRRMGLSQQESQVWTSLMRNQGQIATQEDTNRIVGKRDVERQQDIKMNRSVESFMAHFEHGLADVTGATKAKELGARFLTKVSAAAERAMDNFLGIEKQALTMEEQRAIVRLGSGSSTRQDRERTDFLGTAAGGVGGNVQDLFRKSTAESLLEAMGMHTTQTYGAMMQGRGVDLRELDARQQAAAERDRLASAVGVVRAPEDVLGLKELKGRDDVDIIHRMHLAQLGGGREGIYQAFKGEFSANTLDAYAHRVGFGLNESNFTMGGTGTSNRALQIGVGAVGGLATGALTGAAIGSAILPGIGTAAGALVGGAVGAAAGGGLAFLDTPLSNQDKALDFIARGGHAGKAALHEAGAARIEAEGGLSTRTGMAAPGSYGQPFGGLKVFSSGSQGPVTGSTALAKALQKKIDPQMVRTVLEDESFSNSIRRLPGMSGRAADLELKTMELAASNMKDPEQKRAAGVMIEELRYNMKQNNGRIGSEWTEALNDPSKNVEKQKMYNDMLSQYDKMKDILGKEGGGPAMEKLRSAIGDAGNALWAGGKGTREEVEKQAKLSAKAISEMSPEELSKVQELIGGTEYGKNLINIGIQRQGAAKQMAGKGRRGVKGGADAIFGALTGNSLSEMDLTVGGTQVQTRGRAQMIYQQFRDDGKHADELEAEVIKQLAKQGVKHAKEYVQDVRKTIRSDKKVSVEEGGALHDKLAYDEDIQKVQAAGIRRAQEQSDPLGVTRNDLLGEIRDTLNVIRDKEPGLNQSGP